MKKHFSCLQATTLLAVLCCSHGSVSAEPLAFPGAEGFGSSTRGAYELFEETGDPADLPQIIHITTTADGGAGSFREAVATEGPRIIVFDLGGLITLETNIFHQGFMGTATPPYMTIAGQTAPGDGICIRNGRVTFGGTHDLIIRGLRFRPGDNPNSGNSANFGAIGDWREADIASYDIIFDHISSSWSTGKLVGTYYNISYVSITNCIFSEPLQNCSGATKPDHNYAATIGGGTHHSTFAHNIIVHSRFRNPLFGRGTAGDGSAMSSLSASNYGESINNVVFNDGWASFSATSNTRPGDGYLPSYIVGVGDYRVAGSNATGNYQYVLQNETDGENSYLHPESRVYLFGNISTLRTSQSQPQDAVFLNENTSPHPSILVEAWPFEASNVRVLDAQESYDELITNGMVGDVPMAGAYPRDSVDARAVSDVINNTGVWISHENEVGGFPEYRRGSTPLDTDQDGMPDEWESSHGLDDTDPSDTHLDRDGDGYRNIEEYINSFFRTESDETEIDGGPGDADVNEDLYDANVPPVDAGPDDGEGDIDADIGGNIDNTDGGVDEVEDVDGEGCTCRVVRGVPLALQTLSLLPFI